MFITKKIGTHYRSMEEVTGGNLMHNYLQHSIYMKNSAYLMIGFMCIDLDKGRAPTDFSTHLTQSK